MRLCTRRRERLHLDNLERRLRDERGVSLVVTLAVLAVIMVLGGAAVKYSSSNALSDDRSATYSEAVTVGEAGMNLARATLWNAADPVEIDGVTLKYRGNYDSANQLPTLSGTSFMPSENPGAAPRSRWRKTSGSVASRPVTRPGIPRPTCWSWWRTARAGTRASTSSTTRSSKAFSLTEIDVSQGGEFWGSAITRRVEFVDGTHMRPIPGGVFPILQGMPQETGTEPALENVPGSYTVSHG